jgi:hypothetical protein
MHPANECVEESDYTTTVFPSAAKNARTDLFARIPRFSIAAMIAMTESLPTAQPVSALEHPAPPAKPRNWLDRSLTDLHLRICAVLTLGLILMPAEGLPGVELCMFKRTTDLPCPGCGLTRCGSNLVRGNVARAFNYNPFGLIIIPVMAGMGVMAVLPRRWRDGVRRFQAAHSTAFHRFLILFTIGFVLFGLIRSVSVYARWSNYFTAIWL